MIDIDKYYDELSAMLLEIPEEVSEFHSKLLLLQQYLNRTLLMSYDICKSSKSEEDPKTRQDLKLLLGRVNATHKHLVLTKQNFNMIMNKPALFEDKKPSARPIEEMDMPGKESPGQIEEEEWELPKTTKELREGVKKIDDEENLF